MDNDSFIKPNSSSGNIGVRSAIEFRHKTDFFPTEELGDNADIIKELVYVPEETRVGWFDIVEAKRKYANVDYLVIRDVELLGKIGKKLGYVKICTNYKYKDKYFHEYSEELKDIKDEIEPEYIVIQGGWKIPIFIRDFERLPNNAKAFIRLVEVFVGKKVKLIGIGPNVKDVVYKE